MSLKHNVKELAIKAGVNRAIVFAVLTYSWSILAGPLSIFLIITFMTPSEQGYYYTFYGVLALANLLELGAGAVFQFMAGHTWAKLGLDRAGTKARDAETGQDVPLTDKGLSAAVPLTAGRLLSTAPLTGRTTAVTGGRLSKTRVAVA